MIQIAIVSNMKPCDEVRMYKRFGLSLAHTGNYDVNIIGLPAKRQPDKQSSIKFHSLSHTSNSKTNRLRRSFQVIRKLRKIQSKVTIFTSPDLLLLYLLFNPIPSSKIIYDIQEDYAKNIIYQRLYPPILRDLLALLVRSIEKLSSYGIHWFFLAESTYEDDIPYLRNKSNISILENKYHQLTETKHNYNQTPIRLLFSGTISEYAGIQHAVSIYEALKKYKPDIELCIVGICHSKKWQKLLKEMSDSDRNIKLIGVTEFVDHDTIIANILESSIAIIGYEPNDVCKDKMPSKLYEYISLGIPFLIANHKKWTGIITNEKQAFKVDFKDIKSEDISNWYDDINENDFFDPTQKGMWLQEKDKIRNAINDLIKEL